MTTDHIALYAKDPEREKEFFKTYIDGKAESSQNSMTEESKC